MNQEKIGAFIAKLRKERDMTQEQLAIKLGVSDKSISRWENGKTMPDLSLFIPLSEELDVSVNDLMNGEIVVKKEYQETFEKNVVKTISKVEKNNRLWNIVCNSVIIGVVILFFGFVCHLFLDNYRFKIDYDPDYMEVVDIGNNQLEFSIFNTPNPYPEYMLKTYKNNDGETVGVVFVMGSQSLLSSSRNKEKRMACLTFKGCLWHGTKINLDVDGFPSSYDVYYAKSSFKKIRYANVDELKRIIVESDLIYSNTVED